MNKIKKILVSFGVFFSSLISKVFALTAVPLDDRLQAMYGVFEPKEPTIGEKFLNISRFVIPIILFVIGLFIVLNKKITKRVKIIVISIFIVFTISFLILANYLLNI